METRDQQPTMAVMDVVVCTGSQEVTLTSTLNFPDGVEKILDIRANICNIIYHIMGNKLIVQGLLYKQIFYLNCQGKTKFETEQLPFATFIEMGGVLPSHTIRIAGRVAHMQRQLSRQDGLAKQKTTLLFEAAALESCRYQIDAGAGYRYRVREIIFRKECRGEEQVQTVCRLPVQSIRAIDIRLNHISACAQADKVIVRGSITRKIDYTAATRNQNLHEEHPFEYCFEVPGAKPGMSTVIQGENGGKLVQGAIPVVKEEGTVILQQISFVFFVYVCHYKQLYLAHGEGPVLLLQKPAGTGSFTRVFEHDLEPLFGVASVQKVETRLSGVEQELVAQQMFVWGDIEYKIIYLAADGRPHETSAIQPFVAALDFTGSTADNFGEIRLSSARTETAVLDRRIIRLSCRIQFDGETFEELLLPVAAQQLHLI